MTTMDGLPKQFVSSLKILFDILDENRTGFVRLKDIESRWSDDGVRGLPAGVVEGLRRVTPQDGLLSFDRFVSGLKLVLNTRRTNEPRKPFSSKENRAPYNHDYRMQNDAPSREPPHYYGNDSHQAYSASRRSQINHHDPTQEPMSYNSSQAHKKIDQRHNNDNNQLYSGRMNDASSGQTSYRPQRDESPIRHDANFNTYAIKADVRNYPSIMGSHQSPSKQTVLSGHTDVRGFLRNTQPENPPALPPRAISGTSRMGASTHNNSNIPNHMRKSHSGPDLHQTQSPPAVPPRTQRQNPHILTDLKNWQREWTANQGTTGEPEKWQSKGLRVPSSQSGKYDNNAIYANIDQFQRKPEDLSKQQIPQKATVRRHGSGRRHTLSSGIDQNMLKRMKQLDEEKAILQSGLAMVDSAREWYLKQLSAIGDKQAMLGKVSFNDNSLEAHQERMSFQKARVAEVNQQLSALVESSEKGFPLHINLAMTSNRHAGDQEKTLINRNRKLMEEMDYKSGQISQLEKEKASLIRELFEARSKNKPSHDDTTFM